MKTLSKTLVLAVLVIFAAACGNTVDKKAQLASMVKERDALNEKIKTLEAELKVNDSTSEKKMTHVLITPAEIAEFNHYLEVQGKVDGEDNIAVSAQMAGVLTSVYVKEGDAVRKGQVLAQIDNSVSETTG